MPRNDEDEIERANPEREGGTEDEEGTKAVPLPIQSLRDDEAAEGKEKGTKKSRGRWTPQREILQEVRNASFLWEGPIINAI